MLQTDQRNLLERRNYAIIETSLPEPGIFESGNLKEALLPKLRQGQQLTDNERVQRMQVILKSLSEGNTVAHSCNLANINTCTHYAWAEKYPQYEEAIHESIEAGIQYLEQAAIERGAKGVDKAVYYKGEVVGSERVYSDSLLQFMLKAKRPETYRESRNAEVNVNVKHSVETVPQSIWTEFEKLDGMKRVGTGEVITVKPDSGLVDNGTSDQGDT